MKSKLVVLLFVVLICGFVWGAEPDTGIGEEDVEKIEKLTKGNFSDYKPYVSNATKRIEAINVYVGPITRVLWGVELELSWVFVFAFVVWILLIELIIVPVSSIFDWDLWWTLLGSAIIATLAMQGFGKDLVVWMESLMTQWWIGFVVLFFAFVVGALYSMFFGFVKKWAERQRKADEKAGVDRDRKILHIEAKMIKDSF